MYKYITYIIFAFMLSCTGKQGKSIEKEENTISKTMLQGTWLDENTDIPTLQIKGDSIYYMDLSTSPVAFKVIDDSLITYGIHTTYYHIKNQSQYTVCLQSELGELIQLSKSESAIDSIAFPTLPIHTPPSDVIQKDRVIFYKNIRYRGYVYINPSQMKVIRPEYSEEGFKVDKVYYDNIIHICVFEGKNKLFGKDISKKEFKGVIPDDFLQWAILADMEFKGVDEKGYQYQAKIAIPDEASSYHVNLSISPEGLIAYSLEE